MKITSYRNTSTARGPRPLNSNSITCSVSISLANFFFKNILLRKNWRGVGKLFLKNGTIDGSANSTNHVFARAGLILRGAGAPGTLRVFTTSSCRIYVKTKKVSLSEHRAPGTVPDGKFNPGYSTRFIKKLDDGLR